MKETTNHNKIIVILFVMYMILLTWIILFKMQFNFAQLPDIQSINLIPFKEAVVVNGERNFTEAFDNFLVFIPVGAYLGMLLRKEKFYKKVIPILLLSLFYEVSQFVFHIGASDITDVLTNTTGGILGILAINLLYKMGKSEEKTSKILTILAVGCTLVIVGFISLLIIANL